jgi:DNA-binding LacI/PurR family transcriptional regulator
MPTLKDIAIKAGVNLSTVSRALKGSDEINIETREKIINIARDLGYVSNKNEKEYSKVNLKTIGLICPEIVSIFYAQLVSTIEEKIREFGYTVFIGLTNFEYETELHYLNLFEKKSLDGIVFITSFDERIKDELKNFKKKCDIPLIQVASEIEVEEYDSIHIDNHLGVVLAVEHLIELGHKQICYIGEELTKDRLKYFLEVMKSHNLKIENDFIRSGKERREAAGYLRMKELFSAKNKLPTAIFASYDDVAIGAMKAIYENGLKVPEDISVIGIDDISIASYLYNSLSTISSPVSEMGNIAMRILFEKIQNKKNTVIQHINIKPQLVLRDSTKRINETE